MIAKFKNAFWGAHDYVVGAYFVAAFIVKRHISERQARKADIERARRG